MSSLYPGALDALSTTHTDNIKEIIHASTINDLADAINKIEAELGINPSGAFATVTLAMLAATGTNIARGTGASVTAGTATVNVTHGLGGTPTKVYLSPTADTQGLRWWVSAKGSTTFTITLNANATTNPVTFDWSAVV